jgi:hypothetical protein
MPTQQLGESFWKALVSLHDQVKDQLEPVLHNGTLTVDWYPVMSYSYIRRIIPALSYPVYKRFLTIFDGVLFSGWAVEDEGGAAKANPRVDGASQDALDLDEEEDYRQEGDYGVDDQTWVDDEKWAQDIAPFILPDDGNLSSITVNISGSPVTLDLTGKLGSGGYSIVMEYVVVS